MAIATKAEHWTLLALRQAESTCLMQPCTDVVERWPDRRLHSCCCTLQALEQATPSDACAYELGGKQQQRATGSKFWGNFTLLAGHPAPSECLQEPVRTSNCFLARTPGSKQPRSRQIGAIKRDTRSLDYSSSDPRRPALGPVPIPTPVHRSGCN